jgi:hypothetical protein
MMNKMTRIGSLVGATWLFLCNPAHALTNSAPHIYPGDVKVALQIESDLYNSLDTKYRHRLQGSSVEKDNDSITLYQASVSASLVDLINHIAHAKAIDKIEPGYFDRYMSGLGRSTVNGNPPVAPNIMEDRYWTDAVMNEQASYFNQMMGMTMAINLSHRYLGEFNKYAREMQGDKLVPLNNLLTPTEWEKGVRAGAVNALNCALGTEGAKALFDAIDKMPGRPAWTACLVPQKTDIKRLNKQLGKYEVAFFRGGLN